MSRKTAGLVGDIGATNARFALADADGVLSSFSTQPCAAHASMAEAVVAYLSEVGAAAPRHAVLAVATTPREGRVDFTNLPWSFKVEELAQRLGLTHLSVINDFHANALAIACLGAEDVEKVGAGEAVPDAPAGVIGPGSGLGVSTIAPGPGGALPIVGEGGHVTMAAADDAESAVLDFLRGRHGHVSAERVLSGPGLVNLYTALCAIDGVKSAPLTAAEITDPEIAARDAQAANAVAMFCAMLGTVAGNLALTVGARGGIYIAGGIVPKLGERFARSPFRSRFEDKGRFGTYLATIPTYVIRRPDAALLGAARLLGEVS